MQRKLHPLEGLVAAFALVIALTLTIGFAQAGEAKKQKAVFLRSSAVATAPASSCRPRWVLGAASRSAGGAVRGGVEGACSVVGRPSNCTPRGPWRQEKTTTSRVTFFRRTTRCCGFTVLGRFHACEPVVHVPWRIVHGLGAPHPRVGRGLSTGCPRASYRTSVLFFARIASNVPGRHARSGSGGRRGPDRV